MKLSSSVFLLVVFVVGTVAAKTTQTADVSKPSQGSVNGGKFEVHQICNSAKTTKAEISSLKNEVEMLRKDLTQRCQRLDKNETNYKGTRAIDL